MDRDRLLAEVRRIRSDARIDSYDEASTKQTVILPLLAALGWSIFDIDEVCPEYSVRGGNVDFALQCQGGTKVFIEVKKPQEDLAHHQEQLLNYAFKHGVPEALLTNGTTWWFYLPLREGSWEQRKFYTIEIRDREENEVADRFASFLERGNVESGKALRTAEQVYSSRRKIELMEETLPKAWDKLITEPDELLVELVAETTEKLCGHRPDTTMVEKFLGRPSLPREQVEPQVRSKRRPRRAVSPPTKTPPDIYKGTSIVAFTFLGRRYPVRTWKEMLLGICALISQSQGADFSRVLSLEGRKRPYFSRNRNDMRQPEAVTGTGFYVETNLSADSIVRLSRKVLSLFGYDERNLSIEIEEQS